MSETFEELPNWTVDIDEVSAGVYVLIAVDAFGKKFVLRGSDPNALIADFKVSALKLETEAHSLDQSN